VGRFEYRAVSAAEALRANLRSLGVLAFGFVAALLFAVWAAGVRKP